MTVYEAYKKKKFSLDAFGIMRREGRSDYFCTPKNASIIGWTGVDGIHYCTIKPFGETVFAVNPYGDYLKHAFPVAENFEAFLRLLITCGHEAYLEQAHAWTREKYNEFAAENPITEEQKAAADALMNTYSLTPMDDPYRYLKEIYDGFDFTKIPYRKDYFDIVPPPEEDPAEQKPREWQKVYSNCSFDGDHDPGERAGRELPIGKRFKWGEREVYIPSGYLCKSALVLDLIFEVPIEKVQAFIDEYGDLENREDELTPSLIASIRDKNPLNAEFRSSVTLNGKELRNKHGRVVYYVVGVDAGQYTYSTNVALASVAHYGLDENKCYTIHRVSFPWATKAKPKIKTLTLHLEKRPVTIHAGQFATEGAGQTVTFTHPITGEEYTLVVEGLEHGKINNQNPEFEIPAHYTELSYTVTPEIEKGRLILGDTRPSDQPKRKQPPKPSGKYDFESTAIGIIGGVDGPTAVLVAGKNSDQTKRTAMSSLTFARRDKIEWAVSFREKTVEDLDITLL